MVGPQPGCQWKGALRNPGREGQALAIRNAILSGLATGPPSLHYARKVGEYGLKV